MLVRPIQIAGKGVYDPLRLIDFAGTRGFNNTITRFRGPGGEAAERNKLLLLCLLETSWHVRYL